MSRLSIAISPYDRTSFGYLVVVLLSLVGDPGVEPSGAFALAFARFLPPRFMYWRGLVLLLAVLQRDLALTRRSSGRASLR
jgi:hypothetical protein